MNSKFATADEMIAEWTRLEGECPRLAALVKQAGGSPPSAPPRFGAESVGVYQTPENYSIALAAHHAALRAMLDSIGKPSGRTAASPTPAHKAGATSTATATAPKTATEVLLAARGVTDITALAGTGKASAKNFSLPK